MTHSPRKEIVRLRRLYTGETHQQAVTAMTHDTAPLPSAGNSDQQVLESEIMVALTTLDGSDRNMRKARWWSAEHPLMIESVTPTTDRLAITVRADRLIEFCWTLRPGPGWRSSLGSVDELDFECKRNRVELFHRGKHARVIVRVRPAAWLSALAAAQQVREPRVRTPRLMLNPRWGRDNQECLNPERALAGSELLRRAALFTHGEGARWITRWTDTCLTGPQHVAKWLDDPVPAELARKLTHPQLGVRIPKPARYVRDPWTDHQLASDSRFLIGIDYDDMIKAKTEPVRGGADGL